MAFEILFPAALGSLSIDPIARIVLGRPEFQVFRIAAAAIVAGVQHLHSFGDRPVRQFPGQAVDHWVASGHKHAPIAEGAKLARPDMTARLRIDFDIGLQSLCGRAAHLPA
jgi:hypothetical protein